MLLAELTAQAKARGQSLHEKLDELFRRFGVHAEKQISVTMPGAEGMDRMKALMAGFRRQAPASLAGVPVARVRDYAIGQQWSPGGKHEPLAGPRGDLVMFDLEADGNYVAVRPSGTEPKVKFYMFAFDPPAKSVDLEAAKQGLTARLQGFENDLRKLAGV